MKKSIIININKNDKFIAWFSNNSFLTIEGFSSKEIADIWLDTLFKRHSNLCTFGYYNDCNFEIINRILKAEEIL